MISLYPDDYSTYIRNRANYSGGWSPQSERINSLNAGIKAGYRF